MTREKILSVFEFYTEQFEKLAIPCRQLSDDEYDKIKASNLARWKLLMHAHWMSVEMYGILANNPEKIGKANRWLGHIQGILVSCGIFSINNLRDHSRP